MRILPEQEFSSAALWVSVPVQDGVLFGLVVIVAEYSIERWWAAFRTRSARLRDGFLSAQAQIQHVPSAERLVALVVSVALVSAGFGIGRILESSQGTGARSSQEQVTPGQSRIHQASLSRDYTDTDRHEAASVRDTIVSIISSSRRHMNRSEVQALAQTILEESENQGFDPLFVTAVIKAESTFRHSVVSHKGARGLMQLLPSTGRYISEKRQIEWSGGQDLHDPALNIRLGLAYLRYLEEKFDFSPEETLIAYNWGPGNLILSRRKGGAVPSVSRRYAQTILTESQMWQRSVRVQLASLPTSERA